MADRPDARLIELGVEAQADLIVVGTHQSHGISRLRRPSVSRGILRHAPMSVACVPAFAASPIPGRSARECRRVLVAVDLNQRPGFAVPCGYSIVQSGGTVRLLHNSPPFRLPDPTIGVFFQEHPTEEDRAQFVANCESSLRAFVPAGAEARGITTEVEVTDSRETADAICSAAERFDADVVCIGGHTRPTFTAKVLGSVSLAVLQDSGRPVLVVWPPAE